MRYYVVSRYKLLLESLVKHTPSGHHDLHDLQEALILVSLVANQNNEHIKRQQGQWTGAPAQPAGRTSQLGDTSR